LYTSGKYDAKHCSNGNVWINGIIGFKISLSPKPSQQKQRQNQIHMLTKSKNVCSMSTTY
jgi:hypothetical protein